MRKPLSSVGFLVLLVGLGGSITTPKAQAQKYLAPNYNHCARPFYDPQSYNWYSVQNTCSFAIKVVLVAFSGDHGSGALDLGPGRHDGTGRPRAKFASTAAMTCISVQRDIRRSTRTMNISGRSIVLILSSGV